MDVLEHCQVNMRINRATSRALDLAVDHANKSGGHLRVTRASVLREALVAHLSNHPSRRVRSIVAPGVA